MVYDAYFRRAKDSHGCPVLIEDDNMCCGCPPPDAGADGGKDGGADAGWIDPGFRVSLVGVSVVLEARPDAMLSYVTCQSEIAVEKRESARGYPCVTIGRRRTRAITSTANTCPRASASAVT
jgi:hypothetical protein